VLEVFSGSACDKCCRIFFVKSLYSIIQVRSRLKALKAARVLAKSGSEFFKAFQKLLS
jgi:hypothetical protein